MKNGLSSVFSILFLGYFAVFFEISAAELSARAFYVVAKALAYGCRHAEFFEFSQKIFGCVNARSLMISLFDFVEPYEIDVRRKAFCEPCKLSCASVRIVLALYERILEYDSSARFSK